MIPADLLPYYSLLPAVLLIGFWLLKVALDVRDLKETRKWDPQNHNQTWLNDLTEVTHREKEVDMDLSKEQVQDIIKAVKGAASKSSDTFQEFLDNVLKAVKSGGADAPTIPVPTTDHPTTEIPSTSSTSQLVIPTDDPIWLGEWSKPIWNFVRDKVTAAKGKTVLFVGYNIPGRDNGNYSAGGPDANKTPQQFYDWYGSIADAIGDGPAWMILEPDALGLGTALPQNVLDERFAMLQGAINGMKKKPNLKVFVDASMWIDPAKMAEMLKRLKGMDGFSCNVSGNTSTEEVIAWADQVSQLTGISYVMDTSRNGNGNPHKPAWCNVTDTKVGVKPTTKTASPHCLAYLWIKVPGESDGKKINGYDNDGQQDRSDVPGAGTMWPEFRDAIYSGNWADFKKKYKV